MKKTVKISILAIVAMFVSVVVFTSCNKNSGVNPGDGIDAVALMQKDAADAVPPTFDTTMCHGHGHGHGMSDGKHHGDDSLYTHTKLAVAALPANVAAYIKANYATATFKDAVKIVVKASGATKSYLVLLIDATNTAIGLRFDGTGAFVAAHTGPVGKGKGGGPGPH